MELKKPLIKIISLIVLFNLSTFAYAADNEWRCNNYAAEAVAQNRQNQAAACGFTGLRWSNNKAGQKQWCLSVNKKISRQESNIRKKMLNACFARKSKRRNPSNQLNLPRKCKDPSRRYIPIRRIYPWYRYERELYTPVKPNGLIRYDFNRDGRRDFIFIERNLKNEIRLIQCFSTVNGYQRSLTGVAFDAVSNDLFSERYGFSNKNGDLQINIESFAHNEGTCFAQGSYHYSKSQHKFEIQTQHSSCSAVKDPVTGEDYPITPLPLILSDIKK